MKHPTDTIWITDCSVISNPAEKNPDNWMEIPGGAYFFSRNPDNVVFFDTDPIRAVNRHNKRCNAGFVDGHAQAIKVSAMGLQFFPGRDASGKLATGAEWLGGNGKYDSRWLWDTE